LIVKADRFHQLSIDLTCTVGGF